ncbi:MAG: DUF6273 domain-containing protein [Bacillota bacterium]
MKRILSTILAIMVISAIVTLAPASLQTGVTAYAAPTLKIGDYMTMGKYNDEPILWRCVDIDENGPLMLSDKIICLKPFDASGIHYYADGTLQAEEPYRTDMLRASEGSNLWETSSLRSWLNSSEKAGSVKWLDQCPPNDENVYNGLNDYGNEKGFLSEGNFSSSERAMIKSVSQLQILNELVAPKLKTSGSEALQFDDNISSFLQNYDTAFSYKVTDKMFCLDLKQLNNLMQKQDDLGKDYYKCKLTAKAILTSEYKNSLDTERSKRYWMRTPEGINCRGVRVVDGRDMEESIITSSNARCNYGAPEGVRPAFYIDLTSGGFNSGNGTESSPYVYAKDDLVFVLLIGGIIAGILVLALIGFMFFKKKKKGATPLGAAPEAWTGYAPAASPAASPSETAPFESFGSCVLRKLWYASR